jgi:tRNA-Thr(GGU) m(6)t(6)A37 methyltransferase TsaA
MLKPYVPVNHISLGLACLITFLAPATVLPAREVPEKAATVELYVIGRVAKSDKQTTIVLDKEYEPGLLGLNKFSHVWVFCWFHKNDTPRQRSILQIHPKGDPQNPLTGVFAARSPVRPNLLSLSLCKIKAVKQNIVELENIDVFDGTPVLDIKPYAPGLDSAQATGPRIEKDK